MIESGSNKHSKTKIWLESLSLNLWSGMTLSNWRELLTRAGIDEIRQKPFLIFSTTLISIVNSVAARLEDYLYREKIDHTDLVTPPIFIIGHWRTGTTHLHNLISQDVQFTYPTTYTCMFPEHFLLSERLIKRIYSLPETRPMDNIAMHWDFPQEDELAIALISDLSPYRDWAFPNRPPIHRKYLDFRETSMEEREQYKEVIVKFIRKHTFRSKKQIVMKSPAHSFRIKLLVEAFPEAKFIHLYRDPITVFMSSVNMFSVVREQVGLTKPDNTRLEEMIIQNMLHCYERIWEDQTNLSSDQFHEMRFEELERKPIEELRKCYEKLRLVGYENAKPKFETYISSISDYKKNVYNISENKMLELIEILDPIIKRYEYEY